MLADPPKIKQYAHAGRCKRLMWGRHLPGSTDAGQRASQAVRVLLEARCAACGHD